MLLFAFDPLLLFLDETRIEKFNERKASRLCENSESTAQYLDTVSFPTFFQLDLGKD
jgi:hypothetical protein